MVVFSNVVNVDQLIAGAVLVKDLTCAPSPAATIDTITGGTGIATKCLMGYSCCGITAVTGTTFTANQLQRESPFVIPDSPLFGND
jgi:hypothetical protein